MLPIESLIRYLGNGIILSSDKELDRQVNEILNLNYSRLKTNRSKVFEAVRDALDKKSGTRKAKEIKDILHNWTNPVHGKLPEYFGVAVYFLNKRLMQLSK